MKDFVDRQPTKAGRRKITYEDGTSEFVTVEMADEPTRDGTPLNRDTLMNMQGFSSERTTITKKGNVTTVNVEHEDGGVTVTVITKETSTLTKVVTTYTGPSGLTNTKEMTIDMSGEDIVIGGVTT